MAPEDGAAPGADLPEAGHDNCAQGGFYRGLFLRPGDRVEHKSWGEGAVFEVLGAGDNSEAVVCFRPEIGVRHLLLSHAPLRVISRVGAPDFFDFAAGIEDKLGRAGFGAIFDAVRAGVLPSFPFDPTEQNGVSTKKPGRGLSKKSIALRAKLQEIVAEQQPMTLRQVFYQATVRHLVPKTEAGYRAIGYQLLQMRRDGSLPYHWISDNTRWMRKPNSYSNISARFE